MSGRRNFWTVRADQGLSSIFPRSWVRSCLRTCARREIIRAPRFQRMAKSSGPVSPNRPASCATRRINARRPPSGHARSINCGCHTDYEPGERPLIKIAPNHRLCALRQRQMADSYCARCPGFSSPLTPCPCIDGRKGYVLSILAMPSESGRKPVLPACGLARLGPRSQ